MSWQHKVKRFVDVQCRKLETMHIKFQTRVQHLHNIFIERDQCLIMSITALTFLMYPAF